MKKKNFLKSLLAVGLILLLGSNGCKNGSSLDDTIVKTGTEYGPCFHDQNEMYGDFTYEYLKYNIAFSPPEELIPEGFRDEFVHSLDSLKTMMAGWDVQDILDHFESENLLSHDVAIDFMEVYNIIEGLLSGVTAEATISLIQQLTNTKSADPNITCGDKSKIVAINSIYKNILTYLDEVGFFDPGPQIGGDQLQFRGCNWLETIGCTILGVAGFTVGAIFGAAISLPFIVGCAGAGDPDCYETVFWTFVVGGALIGLNAATNNCCPEDLDCKKVMGVSLSFASCLPIAIFSPWGFGSDVSSLAWLNAGGTPPTAITLPAAPSLTITQNSIAIPVTAAITTACGGSTKTSAFTRNLATEVTNVVGVTLSGTTNVYPPDGIPYRYYAVGISSNASLSSTWAVANGTIVNSTNSYVEVLWDLSMTEGEVGLTVQNTCPGGDTALFELSVSNADPDIP